MDVFKRFSAASLKLQLTKLAIFHIECNRKTAKMFPSETWRATRGVINVHVAYCQGGDYQDSL